MNFFSHFKINVFIACSIFFQYLIVSRIFLLNLFEYFSWMPICYLACLIKYDVCLIYHILSSCQIIHTLCNLVKFLACSCSAIINKNYSKIIKHAFLKPSGHLKVINFHNWSLLKISYKSVTFFNFITIFYLWYIYSNLWKLLFYIFWYIFIKSHYM